MGETTSRASVGGVRKSARKMSRYRDEANDRELIDRKFRETYEPLIAPNKSAMAKCGEIGCVIKLFTKGFDFK